MRYLLVVGFSCDVFKQEPQARIFVGDQLIDEFYIQYYKDTLGPAEKEFQKNTNILKPLTNSLFANLFKKNLPPLRFYEVEIDTKLDKSELRIEMINSDSNYTNGFITCSSLIKLQVCHFFPLHKKLLLRLEKIKHKNRLTQNYAWYRINGNFLFDLIRNGLCWKGKNAQMFNTDSKNLALLKIGGDGVFTCELEKKYQILINKTKKPYRHTFDEIIVDYLLNKYIEHANQRNRN